MVLPPEQGSSQTQRTGSRAPSARQRKASPLHSRDASFRAPSARQRKASPSQSRDASFKAKSPLGLPVVTRCHGTITTSCSGKLSPAGSLLSAGRRPLGSTRDKKGACKERRVPPMMVIQTTDGGEDLWTARVSQSSVAKSVTMDTATVLCAIGQLKMMEMADREGLEMGTEVRTTRDSRIGTAGVATAFATFAPPFPAPAVAPVGQS